MDGLVHMTLEGPMAELLVQVNKENIKKASQLKMENLLYMWNLQRRCMGLFRLHSFSTTTSQVSC
jgi:hypothetical protein